MLNCLVVAMVLDNAEVVGWVSLAVGIGLVGVGAYVGTTTPATETKNAREKLDTAEKAITAAEERMREATTAAANSQPGAENLVAANEAAASAAQAATVKTAEAKTALEQVAGIVGSLPENLRSAGMLVLIGAVLMGVATIQFGGTSLV